MVQGVTILGSTGTIGVNTLDVISRNPERFRVMALSVPSSVGTLHVVRPASSSAREYWRKSD